MQRYGCWLPCTTAFCTLHTSFKIITLLKQQSFGKYFQCREQLGPQRGPLLRARVAQLAGGGRCASAGLGGTVRRSVTVKHIRTPLGSNWKLSHSHMEARATAAAVRKPGAGEVAFLLSKYFSAFKYCDNCSALVVTTQVQEPALPSTMNTMWLPPSFSSQVKSQPFQQEQKQSKENRKMGS